MEKSHSHHDSVWLQCVCSKWLYRVHTVHVRSRSSRTAQSMNDDVHSRSEVTRRQNSDLGGRRGGRHRRSGCSEMRY